MRRLLVLILLTNGLAAALTSGLAAAVPPVTMHEKYRNAPEVVKVRVTETSLVPKQNISCAERFPYAKPEGSQVLSEFTAKLKVLETLRSASGLKPGGVITIKYEVYDQDCPGRVGPPLAVPLKKGKVLYAFLSHLTKTDNGWIALGHDFTTARPKPEPGR